MIKPSLLLTIHILHISNAIETAFVPPNLRHQKLLNTNLVLHKFRAPVPPSPSQLFFSFETNNEKNQNYDKDMEGGTEFIMPSPDKLISDMPAAERGIGVGIDLGTTNSAISLLNEKGIPQMVQVEGKSTIPSVIVLRGNQENDDGIDDNLDDESNNTFVYRNVKRVIGMGTIAAACSAEVVPHLAIQTASQRRKGLSMNKKNKKEGLGGMKLEQIMKEAKESPARLRLPEGYNLDTDDEDEKEISSSTNTALPEYVSSKILEKLFEAAEKATDERITRTVIGVPAYFNDMQREATIKVKTKTRTMFLLNNNGTIIHSNQLNLNRSHYHVYLSFTHAILNIEFTI